MTRNDEGTGNGSDDGHGGDGRLPQRPGAGRADAPGDPARGAVPAAVRRAGALAGLQGVVLLGFAVYLVVRALLGHHEETVKISGYGTAVWFLIMGGAVAAAGFGLVRGARWGRGLVVIAQLVLLPVAYYLGVGSHHWAAGVIVAGTAVVTLYSLFQRSSLEWYAA